MVWIESLSMARLPKPLAVSFILILNIYDAYKDDSFSSFTRAIFLTMWYIEHNWLIDWLIDQFAMKDLSQVCSATVKTDRYLQKAGS